MASSAKVRVEVKAGGGVANKGVLAVIDAAQVKKALSIKGGLTGRIVSTLPDKGEDGYLYLVLKDATEEGDIYDEYLWVLQEDGKTYGWEHLGATHEVRLEVDSELSLESENPVQNKVVAEALQRAGGSADWNEDNPTAGDYIKNRLKVSSCYDLATDYIVDGAGVLPTLTPSVGESGGTVGVSLSDFDPSQVCPTLYQRVQNRCNWGETKKWGIGFKGTYNGQEWFVSLPALRLDVEEGMGCGYRLTSPYGNSGTVIINDWQTYIQFNLGAVGTYPDYETADVKITEIHLQREWNILPSDAMQEWRAYNDGLSGAAGIVPSVDTTDENVFTDAGWTPGAVIPTITKDITDYIEENVVGSTTDYFEIYPAAGGVESGTYFVRWDYITGELRPGLNKIKFCTNKNLWNTNKKRILLFSTIPYDKTFDGTYRGFSVWIDSYVSTGYFLVLRVPSDSYNASRDIIIFPGYTSNATESYFGCVMARTPDNDYKGIRLIGQLGNADPVGTIIMSTDDSMNAIGNRIGTWQRYNGPTIGDAATYYYKRTA